jgi:hypothetical protein
MLILTELNEFIYLKLWIFGAFLREFENFEI